ncbi:MAG: DNA starvation/stationary phase protection protein Dps [Acidobacteriota bacterium]|nr:DNA starvation/stationary phase protection protein Dps [Acidobacteriota bacterium]
MHRTKNDLAKGKREKVIENLNARLADVIDLKTQAKQAHWNVKGHHFISLHELFDQVATAAEAHTDLIAERITALGGTAMGTARVVASRSTLSEYPLEIFEGEAHVDALSTAMSDFGKKVREGIDQTDDLGDKDTADLYTEISRELDKLLWFVEAHIQA